MGARFSSLLIKEAIQFLRDRVILLLILWLYTVEVVICAYALSFDVRNLSLAVVDLDRSPASRNLVERFAVNEAFTLTGYPRTMAEAGDWLEQGRAVLAIVVPERFDRRLRRGEAPEIQVLIDGSNSNTASIARGYVFQILARFQAEWTPGPAARLPSVRAVVRVWYYPEQTFTAFMVLSMIALAALPASASLSVWAIYSSGARPCCWPGRGRRLR